MKSLLDVCQNILELCDDIISANKLKVIEMEKEKEALMSQLSVLQREEWDRRQSKLEGPTATTGLEDR